MILYYQDTYFEGEFIDDITGVDFVDAIALDNSQFGENMEIIYVGF